jgi:hypothetical protein
MNDKELVRVAGDIRDSLLLFQKARYAECIRQLGLFTSTIHTIVHQSGRLGRALSRDWLAAAEECCADVARHLSEIPYTVSRLERLLSKRQRGIPSLSDLVQEIRAAGAEFGGIEFDAEENSLSVITEPITLEEVYLGPFQIALSLGRLHQMQHFVPYHVLALEPHPSAKDEAITHPHVSNDGLCEGDGAAAIRAAVEEGRLSDFFSMVRSILQTYNRDSPYVPLADWDGTPCYDCGYVMDSENVYYCSRCDNPICDDCSRVCTTCGEIVCSNCAGVCSVCDRTLCPRCAKTQCEDCESTCCESCLTDGLCPDCKEERENEDEDEEQEPDQTDEIPNTSQPQPTPLG